MKVKLDFDNKIITLENNVNLDEFIEKVKNIIPNWKDWTLATESTIVWSDPILVPAKPYKPWDWWGYYPTIDYGTGTINKFDSITGSYCMSIND